MDNESIISAIARLETKMDEVKEELIRLRTWRHEAANDINKGVIALTSLNDHDKAIISIEKRLSERACAEHSSQLDKMWNKINWLEKLAWTSLGGVMVITSGAAFELIKLFHGR